MYSHLSTDKKLYNEKDMKDIADEIRNKIPNMSLYYQCIAPNRSYIFPEESDIEFFPEEYEFNHHTLPWGIFQIPTDKIPVIHRMIETGDIADGTATGLFDIYRSKHLKWLSSYNLVSETIYSDWNYESYVEFDTYNMYDGFYAGGYNPTPYYTSARYIAPYAFYGRYKGINLFFEKASYVGEYAFFGCDLNSSRFPSIINISNYGFHSAWLGFNCFPNLRTAGDEALGINVKWNVYPKLNYLGRSAIRLFADDTNYGAVSIVFGSFCSIKSDSLVPYAHPRSGPMYHIYVPGRFYGRYLNNSFWHSYYLSSSLFSFISFSSYRWDHM